MDRAGEWNAETSGKMCDLVASKKREKKKGSVGGSTRQDKTLEAGFLDFQGQVRLPRSMEVYLCLCFLLRANSCCLGRQ